MTVFGVFNIKGGVGKTASAISLAYLSALEGVPTLIWDLDPQGATSFTLRTRTRVRGGGRLALRGELPLDELIRGSDFKHLDVIPADLSNRKIESALSAGAQAKATFLNACRPVSKEYTRIFMDCAPALSSLSECVFSAADVLLCPTIPTPLSLRTLAQLMKHLKGRPGPRPLVLPFFCMVDRRKALHRQTCKWVASQDLGFLQTTIPYSSDVEQMSARREPLFVYAPRSKPSRAYRALWSEIQARMASKPRPAPFSKGTRKALELAARRGDNAGPTRSP